MNFLAHIYLSFDDPKVMVGNFIGDFVKGRNLLAQFEPEIVKGIMLHRTIDEFTDHHPIVSESKRRLRPKYRHYAAVIVDVFYDHFLSRYWGNYHSEPLSNYSSKTYSTLERYWEILPTGVQHMLPHMKKGNWLLNYGELEGIAQALNGMSRRTQHESKMEQSIVELEEFYEDFKKEFELFFPDLTRQSERFLAETPL